ncbi:hypothetical protein QT322_11750 [Escherichia coli]|nr:hypothetical protein [Escherichia coli]
MPYEIPTLGKLIADGEKDIAYELGLQKLPPVSVEQALNVSFSSQVRIYTTIRAGSRTR